MVRLKNGLKSYQNHFILLPVCIIICFSGIFDRDLWTPDEPRVAAISLEMSRNGNLVVPHLAGKPFIEKPPLYFAVAAGLIRTIGPFVGNTGAIRFASVLFALGTLWVTYLLAKRLSGSYIAPLSTAILGTMVGFVENFHWIRVDTALSFFVAASVYCLAEGFLAERPFFLSLAGLFSAGAFLSKGLIGPLMIMIPLAGLFALRLWENRKLSDPKRFNYFDLLSGLLVFILLSGGWIIFLKQRGGPELWNEWFWVNHVGRLTGSATTKGHIHSGEPLYYLFSLAMYSMPWLPILFVRLVALFSQIIKKRAMSKENCFLLIWGMGTVLFLTFCATKRSIYLVPALPAFAIISAMAFKNDMGRAFKVYNKVWFIICAVILAALTGMPFFIKYFNDSVPIKMINFLSTFGFPNLISAVGLSVCLYFILKKTWRSSNPSGFVITTFVLYMGIITGPMHAIDLEKRLLSKVQEFTSQIHESNRPQVAGWNFSETMRANFYYYGNWSVFQIQKKDRIQKILAGKDDQFDSVLFSEVSSILSVVQLPHQVILATNLGSFNHPKNLLWVKGKNFPDGHPQND